MSDDTTMDELGLTRRQALAAAAALCGFGAAAATSAGTAQASGALKIRLADYPALSKVGGVASVGSLGSVPVAVVRTSTRTYTALSRRCPHQGVAVTPRGSGFVCLPPGHGSQFAANGDFLSGVAGRSLTRLKTRRRGGNLFVTV